MKWKTYEPVSSPTVQNKFLRDMQAHLSPKDFRYYCGFNDITTNVHEGTHGVQAYIRIKEGGGRVNAFYVFDSRYITFQEPRVTKSAVAEYIPEEFKDHTLYRMYITGQKAWDDTPLYIFDEWTAYTNGAVLGKSNSEIEYALIFAFFAMSLIECVEEQDPSYNPREVLLPYVEWNVQRCFDISERFGKHESLVRKYKDRYQIIPPFI